MYLPGKRLEELSYFRKLSVSGRKLGVEVVVFTPDDVDEAKGRIHALRYDAAGKRWVRQWTSFPPLVYDRCRYHGRDNFRKITRFRQKYTKLSYLSRPLANKWTVHQALAGSPEVAPYLPATIRYRSTKELAGMLRRHAVVYMKPKNGTGGRGIVRLQRLPGGSAVLMQGRDPGRRILKSERTVLQRIPMRLNGWKLEENYIVQQGIPLALEDGRVHDFRMLVQKDGSGVWQVTGCAGRVGPKLSVTSNLHGGGTAVPMEKLLKKRFGSDDKVSSIRQDAYAMGLRVVEQLETKFGSLCEVGIDLAVDPKGRVWLLEVNPKPSREVFAKIGEKASYRTAITRPLEYALWTLRRKGADE